MSQFSRLATIIGAPLALSAVLAFAPPAGAAITANALTANGLHVNGLDALDGVAVEGAVLPETVSDR